VPRLTCAGPRQAERDDLTKTGGDGAGQKKYKKTKNDRGDEKMTPQRCMHPSANTNHDYPSTPGPYGPSAAVAGATWLLLTFTFPLA